MEYLLYLFIINSLAYFLYCNDKHRAVYNIWRIPEFILFILALLGGALGAMCGMLMFRHKTEKPLFKIGIPLILIVECVILFMMGYPMDILPDIQL